MSLLTLEEACRRLQVSRATLYRWSRQGRLRLVQLGPRATRVREEDLIQLEDRARPVHPPDDQSLWEETRDQDLGRALEAIEQTISRPDLEAYYIALAQRGTPVRWDPARGELVTIKQ
ncbi:helix-turn-helix domain-containing protein [bacterium CPR1]|nr:helix-turn-helix domain-containing protein [bacterium CPR1]